MGTMRLLVDAGDSEAPEQANVARLAALRADPSKRLWLDISDPDRRGRRAAAEGVRLPRADARTLKWL
jgi:hypothetical protein